MLSSVYWNSLLSVLDFICLCEFFPVCIGFHLLMWILLCEYWVSSVNENSLVFVWISSVYCKPIWFIGNRVCIGFYLFMRILSCPYWISCFDGYSLVPVYCFLCLLELFWVCIEFHLFIGILSFLYWVLSVYGNLPCQYWVSSIYGNFLVSVLSFIFLWEVSCLWIWVSSVYENYQVSVFGFIYSC